MERLECLLLTAQSVTPTWADTIVQIQPAMATRIRLMLKNQVSNQVGQAVRKVAQAGLLQQTRLCEENERREEKEGKKEKTGKWYYIYKPDSKKPSYPGSSGVQGRGSREWCCELWAMRLMCATSFNLDTHPSRSRNRNEFASLFTRKDQPLRNDPTINIHVLTLPQHARARGSILDRGLHPFPFPN
jgi:hypothetical protein